MATSADETANNTHKTMNTIEPKTKFTSDIQWSVKLQKRDGSWSVELFDNPADAKRLLRHSTREKTVGGNPYPQFAIYGEIENNDPHWSFLMRVGHKKIERNRSVGDAITGEGELSHYVEYENNQI